MNNQDSLLILLKGSCCSSVVRTSDLNAVDPGSYPVLTTAWICLRVTLESNPLRLVNSQLVCLLPVGVLNCIYL